MTIFTIALYTGIAAALWTVLIGLKSKPDSYLLSFIKNWIGTFFIFSAVIKLVDPVGFSIKLDEYFDVFKMSFLRPLALPMSIGLLVLEAILGVALLFNARMNIITKLLLGLILFFTLLTGVSAIFDVVKDCGCFGDFLKIPAWTSFIKDIVLSALIILVFINRKKFKPVFGKSSSKYVIGLTTLAALAFTLHNYFNNPIWDFRPFKPGSDIVELRKPIRAPEFSNLLTYKNSTTGESKVFENEFPQGDQWQWVSTETKEVDPGIEAPIKDFIINDSEGADISEALVSFEKPIALIVISNAEKAKGKGSEAIKALVDYSNETNEYNYAFLTSSNASVLAEYKEDLGVDGSDLLAAETLLKTMVRANPGVLLITNGVVKGKWHYRNIPEPAQLVKSTD